MLMLQQVFGLGETFVTQWTLVWFVFSVDPRGYRGGSPTAVRPSDPAFCESCPL